jgi:hypothetical protein
MKKELHPLDEMLFYLLIKKDKKKIDYNIRNLEEPHFNVEITEFNSL